MARKLDAVNPLDVLALESCMALRDAASATASNATTAVTAAAAAADNAIPEIATDSTPPMITCAAILPIGI